MTSNSAENQCEKSIDKIISHLNKDGSINTICLVVNGTNSRLTSYTRNALQQVLTILPIEMLENIIVVFTKCVNKRRLNFELSVFQAEFGIKIDPKHTLIIHMQTSSVANKKISKLIMVPSIMNLGMHLKFLTTCVIQ